MLIAKITESDFFGGEPQYIDDDARYNTRGVMTDGEGNIAMMKIEDSEYYKLPGGSIEITETLHGFTLLCGKESIGQVRYCDA